MNYKTKRHEKMAIYVFMTSIRQKNVQIKTKKTILTVVFINSKIKLIPL